MSYQFTFKMKDGRIGEIDTYDPVLLLGLLTMRNNADRYRRLRKIAVKDAGLDALVALNTLDYVATEEQFDSLVDKALGEYGRPPMFQIETKEKQMKTAEQMARDLLERMGATYSAGELVELASLIATVQFYAKDEDGGQMARNVLTRLS